MKGFFGAMVGFFIVSCGGGTATTNPPPKSLIRSVKCSLLKTQTTCEKDGAVPDATCVWRGGKCQTDTVISDDEVEVCDDFLSSATCRAPCVWNTTFCAEKALNCVDYASRVDCEAADCSWADDSCINFVTFAPCSNMKNDGNYDNVISTPIADWRKNDNAIRNTAIVIVFNAIGYHGAALSDTEMYNILTMDCAAMRKVKDFNLLETTTPPNWSNNYRDFAITIVNAVSGVPVNILQGLENTVIAGFLFGK